MITTKWWRPVRKPLIAFGWLLVVVAVFAAGIGIYVAATASWPLRLVWWPQLLAGTAAVVTLGAWWLWWRLPKRQAHGLDLANDKTRADVEDNFRKTISQIFGGAAVLIGAAFAYLQFTDQQRASQQQLQASHDLLISNQVAKGFELLGNKEHEIQQRLGGIYALEGVMKTSEQYHQPVLEALSAFVRDGTQTVTGDGPPATDIQAALTVIGRRAAGEGKPDLHGAHIPGADLRGADLNGADLRATHLNGADLRGAHLNGAFLFEADLSRNAKLSHAHLNDAHLNDAKLMFADLSHAHLNNAVLLRAHLDNADLSNAHLNGADLSSAYLHRAYLRDAHLNGAALNNAHLNDAALSDAHLNGVNLGNTDLNRTFLNGTHLSHADLSYAHLNGANLYADTHLDDANLTHADLNGAYLSEADLRGVRGLIQAQLDQACGTGVKVDQPLTFHDKPPCPKEVPK